MAGHNKWSKVKNVKGKEDAKRAKIFTKMARMIMVATREGGGDPDYNASLKMAVDKAKAENMPNENIERAIKKGLGESGDSVFIESTYEGYGPEGTAVIVECLTDNKNRTASNVRYAFDKNGGNLGTTGSVTFQFDYKGLLVLTDGDYDADEVMMDALDCGAEDVRKENDHVMIISAVDDFIQVKDGLSGKGYDFDVAQLAYLAKNMVEITDDNNIANMKKLIEMLEDDDDVQEVYTNWTYDEKD